MQEKRLAIIIAILTISIFTISSTELFTQSTSAQKRENQTAVKQTKLRPSSRIKKIIKGAENPGEIPDNVAYELFLRTVSEGNARNLILRAGFSAEETEKIVGEAYTFQTVLEDLDRKAFRLKSESDNLPRPALDAEILKLRINKGDLIAKTVERHLRSGLGEKGSGKLQSFIDTEVKRNIQKVLVKNSARTERLAINKSFINSFMPSQTSDDGPLYFYSAAWHDEINVYASASLSEQYGSDTSYRASLSISSPGSRSNTTDSDWGYAPLTHDSGLSIGIEDGTYNIQADFEEQTGYYDQYGNFYGTGSFYVGTSSGSLLVAPIVNVESVSPTELGLNSGESGEFTATVSTTNDVPEQTVVTVEFFETSTRQFNYGVTPSTRRQQFVVTNPGTTSSVDFTVQMQSTTSAGQNTTVTNKARVLSVVPPSPAPSPAIMAGTNAPTATLRYLGPTPTPTPTPNPTPPPTISQICINNGITTINQLQSVQNRCYMRGFDWMEEFCACSGGCGQDGSCSPIVIDTLGNGFSLTNAANGVLFDLDGFGSPLRLSWTSPNTDDAWLALDRNQNNRIDDGTELFGNASEQPAGQNPQQGFASLGMFDAASRGGNDDGKITRKDAVFRKLRLWLDGNHNGISEPEELYRLPALNVVAISLDYKESGRVDQYGNRFKYRSKVRDSQNAHVGRWAWDVFLTVEP